MSSNPGFTINIHVREGVEFNAVRIPSGADDFVSLLIGNQASVFLMNVEQANKLVEAAEEAYFILRGIEDEKARTIRRASRAQVNVPATYVATADPELERLMAEEEEIERRTQWYPRDDGSVSNYPPPPEKIERCTFDNPCSDCLEDAIPYYEDYEPF